MLDVLASLAEIAARRRYQKPTLHDGDELEIKAGRHPVIEAIGDTPFVPNDLYMNGSTERLLIITGPNMGGKSTLLRQTALICLLAQMGSFVPAERARLPVLDRIWTRVGASDDLARGRSTFMVEMTETAAILHNATPRSLVLLDEIGRGTATFDGLSIAWAVAEHLHDSPEHSRQDALRHALSRADRAGRAPARRAELPDPRRRARGRGHLPLQDRARARVEVLRHRGRAPRGAAARRARARARGPDEARTLRAGRVRRGGRRGSPTRRQRRLHRSRTARTATDALGRAARASGRRALAAQITLFDSVNQSLLDELRGVDVETLTGDEARQLLLGLKNRIV